MSKRFMGKTPILFSAFAPDFIGFFHLRPCAVCNSCANMLY